VIKRGLIILYYLIMCNLKVEGSIRKTHLHYLVISKKWTLFIRRLDIKSIHVKVDVYELIGLDLRQFLKVYSK